MSTTTNAKGIGSLASFEDAVRAERMAYEQALSDRLDAVEAFMASGGDSTRRVAQALGFPVDEGHWLADRLRKQVVGNRIRAAAIAAYDAEQAAQLPTVH